MPTLLRSQPDLADVVALARAAERDRERTARELRERERRLARELPVETEDRPALALVWLEAIEREDEAVRAVRRRAESAFHATGLLIALVGIAFGWGVTVGTFYFDGSDRVNVVAVIALLVGLPLLMLVPFLIALLPPRLVQVVPGATAVAALVRALSPGRIALWLWRGLARESVEGTELVASGVEQHQRMYGGLQKWALLRWSQWFAVWFQAAALTTSLLLVVFTDLAFGWSTTLTTGDPAEDARRVHRITETISSPWRWLIPDAHPSLELIQESRYFRVASEPVSRSDAARLGGWWKFVVFAIGLYGLLPRVMAFLIARRRLHAELRAVVSSLPGFSPVLRRLHAAKVETGAVAPETEAGETRDVEPRPAASRRSGEVRVVINWSAVPGEPAASTGFYPGAQFFAAGGAATVGEDAAVIEAIASRLREQPGDILILVKAWEPPLMEFLDFVRALRRAVPPDTAELIVLPVGLGAGGTETGLATPAQVRLWREKLARTGDPSLRVAAEREEVTA